MRSTGGLPEGYLARIPAFYYLWGMKTLPLLSIALIVLLLIVSCENSRRLEPFRWESVSPTVDSVMLALEYAFYDYAPVERLQEKVDLLEQTSVDDKYSEIMGIRTQYWRGRLLQRMALKDSAERLLRTALSDADSVRYPYEFFRLRALVRQSSKVRDAQSYRDIDEESRYYSRIGDIPMLASTYIYMGTILYTIGEMEKGLEYMEKADQLNTDLGFDKLVSRNAINIANVLFRSGRMSEGYEKLHGLLEVPDIRSDSSVYNLVMRNLYAHTKDVSWLIRAYKDVEHDMMFRSLQGLYQMLLSYHYYETGQRDSAAYYSRLAMGNIDYVEDYGYKGMIMQSYASTMESEGKIDSALYYEKRYIEYADSDITRMQQAEVLRMANIREVSLAMTREHEQTQHMRMTFLWILFVVIMGAAVVYFMLYRRQKRHQIASRDSRLEMEKNRRHLLAVMLAMEEKNNLFNSMKVDLERMRKEGSIGSTEAMALENTIKVHLAGEKEWDTFQQLFVQVHPDFVERMHRAYPTLSDSYLKLATYIYMGLDNNKIARLLVIRPESVKQARWRLRRMMNLGKDESLDEAIRALR